MDHKAEAEELLRQSATELDAAWAQVLATQALAHATLAAIPVRIPIPPLDSSGKIDVQQMPTIPRRHPWFGDDYDYPSAPRIWSSTDHDVANEPVVVFQGDKVRAQRDLHAGEYLSNQDYA